MKIKCYEGMIIELSHFETPNELIRILAQIKNISIAEIAKKSGISYPTVMAIMRGSNITKNTSEKLAKVFALDPTFLYRKTLEIKIRNLEQEYKELSKTA